MPISSLTDPHSPGTLVYPRLPREAGRALLVHYADMEPADLRQGGALSHPAAAPVPTGGSPAGPDQIRKVQQAVRDVADATGFPRPLPHGSEQDFDRPCGTVLYETMSIVPADAASEDVWTFLSLIVLPEIGPWRFPGRSEERMLGRPRNVLRRPWWRAWSLGPDLSFAPEGCTPLGEDEFVGIMERPSIGGDQRIARAVRDAIWRLELDGSRVARSQAARELTRRFRAFLSYISVAALSDEELSALLDEAAAAGLAALRR